MVECEVERVSEQRVDRTDDHSKTFVIDRCDVELDEVGRRLDRNRRVRDQSLCRNRRNLFRKLQNE